MKKLALFLALLLSLTAAEAHAQNSVFESVYYSIEPPDGWTAITGELDEKEVEKLPQAVREHYNPKTLDAMFVNLNPLELRDDDFKDTINISVINEQVPDSETLADELKKLLEQQYSSIFEDFRLLSLAWETIGGRKVMAITAQYSILKYSLTMKQFLIPLDKKALIVTCTYDQKRTRNEKLCSDSVASVKAREQ